MDGFDVAIGHIGINAGGKEKAKYMAELLSKLFGISYREGLFSYWAGDLFEIVPDERPRGTNGHIGLLVSDVEAAQRHLMEQGYTFDDAHTVFDGAGRKKIVYLNEELGGFSIHLNQT